MYSAGIPFFFTAATISSDSDFTTRGSFAPWSTSSGLRIVSAWKSGAIACRVADLGVLRFDWNQSKACPGFFERPDPIATPKKSTPTLKVSLSDVILKLAGEIRQQRHDL